MSDNEIDLSQEIGNDKMLQREGIWDEITMTNDKDRADAAEEAANLAAMKPGEDGENSNV
jgi:hypothetical protein